jgi:FtsH-binding integral membrane protein
LRAPAQKSEKKIMSQNPYAFGNQLTAAESSAMERAAFLKRVYSLLLMGILGFAATLWAAANVEPVHGWAMSLGQMIYGSRFGFFLYIGIFIGGSMAVHAVAETKPLNLIAFFAWAFLLGLLISPIVMFANAMDAGIVSQASLITAMIFTGLTGYVFVSGKDFSFLGGILTIGMVALMAVGLAGWIFGFGVGMWFSIAIVLFMAGYILYDTSQILRRYPTTMAVSAAVVLFTDVVIMFKHILIMLMNRR